MNIGMARPLGPGGESRGALRQVAHHLGAMHLSGAILLFTYVIPPAWALDAYGAAPAGNPSADVPPFAIVAVMLFHCVGFHVLVQIPSGLLGTRLGSHHGGMIVYASLLAIAGVLTALALLIVLRVEDVGEVMQLWADFMMRGALGLAGYLWMTQRTRRADR
ncbi:hypothetical protein ACIF8T_38060 [Streptomyces sp. NPDC085946]|uniref:hypothetical protein n=1 Tax=Streptomyces sp. NPDC085946 TaxID=3365744 RepID=UPI0037D199DF